MNNTESLLQSLKQLYSKLHLTSLQKRMGNFFLHTQHHTQHDISKTLHQLIDELVADVSHNTTDNFTIKEKEPETQTTVKADHHARKPSADDDEEQLTHPADHLSFYFKNNKAQEKDPSTAAMLRRRTWEHVHSARRLARSGNKQLAIMHADIVSDSLKTLAHFMPPAEHHQFVSIIVQQLNNNSDKPSADDHDSLVS